MKNIIFKIMLPLLFVRIWLKYNMPYGKAKLFMAYRKYKETFMYRERLIQFGLEFAQESFIENREYNLFLNMLTRTDKLKALFVPYSCIDRDVVL